MRKLLIICGHPNYQLEFAAVADSAGRTVMLVNGAAVSYPGNAAHFATLHPDSIIHNDGWITKRTARGYNCDIDIVCPWKEDGYLPDSDRWIRIQPQNPSGSSSLYAVMAGIAMGYTDIVLIGAPMEDDKYLQYRAGWIAAQDELLKAQVKSVSGWTKNFLESLNEFAVIKGIETR